jgi:hypothetical protein
VRTRERNNTCTYSVFLHFLGARLLLALMDGDLLLEFLCLHHDGIDLLIDCFGLILKLGREILLS